MTDAQTGRTMNAGPGLTISREYDWLVVCAPGPVGPFSHALAVPGASVVPELGLTIETQILPPPLISMHRIEQGRQPCPLPQGEGLLPNENYLWQAMFDYDRMRAVLVLRSRRPGDWFCPSGMGGSRKKLQDYLVDEKVPRRLRDSVPLLLAGEDIVWVIGRRTDERFLPGPETKRVLFVGIENARNCSGFLP
jgi:tRNA(Ile)-lysidine synthase